MKKRSIKLFGHSTSLSLEQIFWNFLKERANNEKTSIAKLIESIDTNRGNSNNLSSHIREWIMITLLQENTLLKEKLTSVKG